MSKKEVSFVGLDSLVDSSFFNNVGNYYGSSSSDNFEELSFADIDLKSDYWLGGVRKSYSRSLESDVINVEGLGSLVEDYSSFNVPHKNFYAKISFVGSYIPGNYFSDDNIISLESSDGLFFVSGIYNKSEFVSRVEDFIRSYNDSNSIFNSVAVLEPFVLGGDLYSVLDDVNFPEVKSLIKTDFVKKSYDDLEYVA